MISNGNLFQRMLETTIEKDLLSSMNPQMRAKYSAFRTIERYVQGIPFIQSPVPYYGVNAYADRQMVKDHFCAFWKREQGLSITERTKLEKIFEHNVTQVSQFASNTPYLIFTNENEMITIQAMEDAIFDALDLKQ